MGLKIPWFMIGYNPLATGLQNLADAVVITSKSVPKEIKDSRALNYSESQIPGGHSSLFRFGSISARKISFDLELANFNSDFGVSLQLSQFDRLRRPPLHLTASSQSARRSPSTNSATSTSSTSPGTLDNLYLPFEPNPSVIYFNSTGRLAPMLYRVLKCDWTTSKPNPLGYPQYAVVSVELAQDEDSTLNKSEEIVAYFTSFLSSVSGTISSIKSMQNSKVKGSPYRKKDTRLF